MFTLFIARSASTHTAPSPSIAVRPRKKVWHLWLKIILGIGITGFILCCLAIGFGRIHSIPSSAATSFGLDRCDDVPCFRGLIPGKTSWSNALATTGNPPVIGLDRGHPIMSLAQSTDHALLDAISIDVPPDTTITVSDVINLYGVPCQIYLYSRSPTTPNVITLRYPGLCVQTGIIEERLTPDSPIRHLYYLTSLAPRQGSAVPCGNDLTSSSSAMVMSGWRPWRGFASLQRYLN